MSAAVVETAAHVDPATADQALERIRVVIGWLLDGVPPSAAVDKVQAEWAVGLRMAQIYVQRAKQLLVEEAEEEELRYYRRLSQQQRDRLIYVLFRALKTVDQMDPKVIRSLASIITAGTRLLESRDRLVLGEAKEAERERKRQESAEVSRLVAEADETLKRGRALLKTGPTPKPQPTPAASPARPIRPLERGEPVFDSKRPLDQRQMTPRQLEEWLDCIAEHGDPRQFPWFKDGALDAALDPHPADEARRQEAFKNAFKLDLVQPTTPASEIAIVPEKKNAGSKGRESRPQDSGGQGLA